MPELRETFMTEETDADLERIFFLATECHGMEAAVLEAPVVEEVPL
jgi:hypothetical protein